MLKKKNANILSISQIKNTFGNSMFPKTGKGQYNLREDRDKKKGCVPFYALYVNIQICCTVTLLSITAGATCVATKLRIRSDC